MKQTENMKA